MTLVIIINAFLCLPVLIAIVGSHAWAIAFSRREAEGMRRAAPEAGVATLVSNDAFSEHSAVIQP